MKNTPTTSGCFSMEVRSVVATKRPTTGSIAGSRCVVCGCMQTVAPLCDRCESLISRALAELRCLRPRDARRLTLIRLATDLTAR